MATIDKDFKVKNGIQVAGNAVVVGNITSAAPVLDAHLTTKLYVDSLIASGSVAVGSVAPSNPTNGMQWLDTIVERLNVYYEGTWRTIATIDDTLNKITFTILLSMEMASLLPDLLTQAQSLSHREHR